MKHKSTEASRILRRAKKYDDALQMEFEKQLDVVMPALCICLHRNAKWGREHLKEFLNAYLRTWEEIAKDNTLSVLTLVEDETGIEMRNEGGQSYHDLDYLNNAPIRPLKECEYIYMRIKQKQWIETCMVGVAFVALHRRERWGYGRLTRMLEWFYEIRDDEFRGRAGELLDACQEETNINMYKGQVV